MSMLLSINGKQIDLGDSLRRHVREKLEAMAEKSGYPCQEATIHFSREGASFRSDVSLHLDRHVLLQAHDAGGDVYAAFDGSCERLAKRVRRYKRKMRDAHRPHGGASARDDDRNAESDESDGPLIIADMSGRIESLSVRQAVSKMLALEDRPALLFRHAIHGRINMVYRRPDGNAAWVDPDLLDGSPSSDS